MKEWVLHLAAGKEWVLHLTAGILSSLSWLYCYLVISERHVLDISGELRYAQMLLETLCFTWLFLSVIPRDKKTRESQAWTEGSEEAKTDKKKSLKPTIERLTKEINNNCDNLDSVSDNENSLLEDCDSGFVVEFESEDSALLECDTSSTHTPYRDHLSMTCVQWTLTFTQIILVLIGVRTLEMILKFYLSYRVLFNLQDMLLAVHLPLCLCIVEVSVAVVYLLKTHIVKQMPDREELSAVMSES